MDFPTPTGEGGFHYLGTDILHYSLGADSCCLAGPIPGRYYMLSQCVFIIKVRSELSDDD